ncbi:alpha/beta fold hydrolase [Allosalinactinospora lopnorensis]|uniref:alpha/beta fold hydrolase n=1 Tax=Allosalinactinospora lopnorensis TaxID=1352348 RepID=UPI000623CBE1|nr:alpha/beta hydrolase [Allosalinactinospora lopnorensis]
MTRDERAAPDSGRSGDTRVLALEDGRELAYTAWGDPDGYPAFYFHGTPGSRLEGALAGQAAKKHGFRLIALDRPGYGLSTFQRNRSFRDWPDDVRALADSLGIHEFGVVGHSGAGPHLFACGCFLPPERLKFIGALAPWGPVATPEIMAGLNPLDRFYARLARRTPLIMRASFAPLGWCAKHRPRLFLSLLRSAVSPPDRAALLDDRLRERLSLSQREAFRQGGRGPAHEALIAYRDWGFDIAAVNVPTHVRLGDRDVFVPRRMGSYLERVLPGVDFRWIEGEGHFALDRWDGILAACAAHT